MSSLQFRELVYCDDHDHKSFGISIGDLYSVAQAMGWRCKLASETSEDESPIIYPIVNKATVG